MEVFAKPCRKWRYYKQSSARSLWVPSGELLRKDHTAQRALSHEMNNDIDARIGFMASTQSSMALLPYLRVPCPQTSFPWADDHSSAFTRRFPRSSNKVPRMHRTELRRECELCGRVRSQGAWEDHLLAGLVRTRLFRSGTPRPARSQLVALNTLALFFLVL